MMDERFVSLITAIQSEIAKKKENIKSSYRPQHTSTHLP